MCGDEGVAIVTKALSSWAPSSGGVDGLPTALFRDAVLGVRREDRRDEVMSAFIQVVSYFIRHDAVGPSLLTLSCRLVGIRKKDGGIRPIAVSSGFLRAVERVVASLARTLVETRLPEQIGCGARGGVSRGVLSAEVSVEAGGCGMSAGYCGVSCPDTCGCTSSSGVSFGL